MREWGEDGARMEHYVHEVVVSCCCRHLSCKLALLRSFDDQLLDADDVHCMIEVFLLGFCRVNAAVGF